MIPKDGYCLLGITNEDLYPSNSYNYVFGESSFDQRVGIFGLYRLNSDNIIKTFVDGNSNRYDYDELIELLRKDSILNRYIKLISHGILHMFCLEHCIFHNCIMFSFNHLF